MDQAIRIAILGNCTTDYLAKALAQACEAHRVSAAVFNCPFRQYNQEIFNKESEFYLSRPELTILFLEGASLFPEWYEIRTILESREKKLSYVRSVFETVVSLADEIHKNCDTLILLNNFKIPFYSPLGILDSKYYPGLKDMISELNLQLSQWAAGKDYVFIFDYRAFAAQYGNINLEDTKMLYTTKTSVSLRYTPELAREYMRYILPMKYMTKKCLVLDLDNTLWGGIAGEDGINGIKLDITDTGRNFYDFQKEILNLYNKGVILAINSKNNEEDALKIIEQHPHMVLRKEHFSVMKINWQDKVTNMLEIAGELNIGTDSIVFFDDSIVERELIRSMLPEVEVVDVPADTSKYAQTIRNLIGFERLSLTKEDLNRNVMYESNRKRSESQKKFNNVDDYLKSLQTKVIIEFSNEFNIPRIAQLTQKTNQFNMTTIRRTQDDIRRFHASSDYIVLACQVTDIYGDNGITGVCIAKTENECAYIDTFLLSCRVLGRNIEYAFFNAVARILADRGAKKIRALLRKSEKNKFYADFYQKAGLSVLSASGNETEYILEDIGSLKKAEQIETLVKGGLS